VQGLWSGRNGNSKSGASGEMSLFPTVGKPSVKVTGWPSRKIHQQLHEIEMRVHVVPAGPEKREQMFEIVFLSARCQALLMSRAQFCQMSGEGAKIPAFEARQVFVPTVEITENTENVLPRFRPVDEKYSPDSLSLPDDGYGRRGVQGLDAPSIPAMLTGGRHRRSRMCASRS
jgi:hypothetical protein